jgi:prolyl oligopeptidase
MTTHVLRNFGAVLVFMELLAAASALSQSFTGRGNPPTARRSDFFETLHGATVPDPYRWLEDQWSKETRDWIDGQMTYSRPTLMNLPSFARVEKRMRELFNIEQVSGVPSVINGKLYYAKRPKNAERFAIYVRDGLKGQERIVLDPAEISNDLSITIGMRGIYGARYLVYDIRHGGEDETEVRIRDLTTGKDLADRFARGFNSGVVFNADLSGFYYTTWDKKKGYKARFHKLGADFAQDRVLYENNNPEESIGVRELAGGNYLLSVNFGWRRNEYYFKDARSDEWRPLVKNLDAYSTIYPMGAGKFWLLTDYGAPNNRLVEIDPANPAPENWKDVLAERPDLLTGFSIAGGKLFARYIHNVSVVIRIHETDGTYIRDLELPDAGNASLPTGALSPDEVFFDFQSFTVPYRIYIYNVRTTERTLFHADTPVFDASNVVVKQEWYESSDGTRVPMYIVHRKDLRLDGNNPTLLVGYGGFRSIRLPSFMSKDAFWTEQDEQVWIEQGGVYAVANIRGGLEFGRLWHNAGMLQFKQNVFDDFIAGAEYLIRRGYTKPAKLAIQGASNGGLLVAAAFTQRPDLFQAVLCDFGDVDLVGQPRFEKNNPPALLEYGDSRDPKQFAYLIRESPYQNVRKGTAYPAVLFSSGDKDSRVEPAQTRKMAAAVQWATSSNRPVLLDYEKEVGHGGAWARGLSATERTRAIARQIAFLNWQLGVLEPPTK